jgi:hypothetical protein
MGSDDYQGQFFSYVLFYSQKNSPRRNPYKSFSQLILER